MGLYNSTNPLALSHHRGWNLCLSPRKVTSKPSTKWKISYLLDCWHGIFSVDGLQLWLLGAPIYSLLIGLETVENSWGCILNIQRHTEEYSIILVQVISVWFSTYSEDRALEMVFTIQKARVDSNLKSPPRTQLEINICKVWTPSWTVFTKGNNDFFNKLFNMLSIWRVKFCIIMLLVWNSLQQRMIWKILS